MANDNPFETQNYPDVFVDILGIHKPYPGFGAKSEPAKTDLADVMPMSLSHHNSGTFNVPVNIAMPMPLKTVIDEKRRGELIRGISSELALMGVEAISVAVDNLSIKLKVQLPKHISVDKIVRGIQTKAQYVWLITDHNLLILNGRSIINIDEISEDAIAAIAS